MPLHRNKLKEIYGTLKSGGFERTYDDFESRFAGSNNYAYRKKVYDLMSANGDVDAPSYEDWMKGLYFEEPKPSPAPKKAAPKAVANQPAAEVAPLQANQPATEDKTTKLLDSVQSTLNENQRVQNRMDYAMGKTGLKTPKTNLGWKGSSTLGFGGNVVETKRRDDVTGGEETVYLTESGNEYGSRAMADVEQGQLDEARFMRENKRAYLMREKERIEREMGRIAETYQTKVGERSKPYANQYEYLYSPEKRWLEEQRKPLEAQLNIIEDALATLDEAEAGKKSDAWIANSSNAWERNAKKLAGFGGGAWRELAHSVGKISTWDFGITDMATNKAILDAANAVDKGTEATKEDQELLDMVAYKNLVEEESEPYLGYGYTAGSIIGESLPFMLEMAINPASGVGKGAMKASMRGMLKKYGKEKLKSNFKKYLLAKAGARVAGDVAGAYAMAGTTGQGGVIADTMNRLTGTVKYSADENGRIIYGGREVKEDDLFDAYLKSLNARAIENHSEMLGNYFAPILKGAGKVVGKGLDKIHLGSVNRFIEDVGATQAAKYIDDFSKKTQWNGVIGEYAEEVAGGIENAMIVGDQTLDTDEQTGVFNLEKNIETFLGVGLMGGFMFGAKLASYRGPKRGALQEMEAAGNRVDRALGGKMQARAQWGEWRSKLLLGNAEEKKNTLREIMDNEKLPIQFRNAVADFSRAAQKYEGLCRAEQSKRLEGSADPVGSSLDDAADAGYELNDPQEMTRTRLALENERERMAAYLGVEVDQVDATVGENLFDYVDDLRNRGVKGEELNRVMDYARARSRYEGMQMRLEDDTNTRIDNVHANMARYAHRENGTVQTGAVKTKDGSRPVWIVSGNLVFEGEGKNRGVNPMKSDESIFVIDAKTGQAEMHPATDFVSLGEPVSAEEVNAYYESSVREQMKKAFDANTHAELSEEKPAEDGELAPANETEGAAVEPAAENATEPAAENATEPAKPAYGIGDVVTLETEEGPVSVEVQAVTADGVEVRTDEPWRGQVVQVIPTEEFEGMMEKPVAEVGVGEEGQQTEAAAEETAENEDGERTEEATAVAEPDGYTEGSPERVETGDNLIVTDEEGNDRSLKVVRRVSMKPSEKGGLEPQEDANGKIVELVDDATGETVRMWDSELAERTKGYMRPVSGSEVESGESSEGQQENPQQGVMPSPKSAEGEGVELSEEAGEEVQPAEPKRNEIPVDEKTGEPVYEAADPGVAWDALVEEAEGDEELAMETVNSMVRDMEEKVKKAKNAKLRAGATAHEKMEAQKERKRHIAEAEERLEAWKRIAGVKAERAAAAESPVAESPVAESPATVETPAAEEATPVQEGAQTPVQEGARGGVQVPHADSAGQEATQDSVTGAAPEAEQTGTTPKGVEAIPTRKNNKGEEEVLYHKVPVARTMADLYDGGMDQEEIDGFVEANSAEAAREVKRIEGKKPKMTTNKAKYMEAKRAWQAELDEAREKEAYWKEVGKEVKRVTHRDEVSVSAEGRGHEAALGEDMPKDEPMDVYEVVASALGRGRIKITPESFRAETGYSVNDQKKYPGMVAKAENGGVSVERAAEMLMEDADMAGFPSDDYTIRQAIIDVLQDGHPAGYISRRREEARRRAAERDEREREEYYQDRYGMNADDGMAYEETAVPNALNQYGGVSEDELAAQSAEAAEAVEAERMKREEEEQLHEAEEGGQQMAGKEEGAGNEAAAEVEEMPAAHESAVDSSMPKTSFTQDEAADFVDKMEARAESAPEMELTIENWDSLFGEDGRVETPIGEVKMGENQFAKLMRQGRNGKLGMIKPTLESPDIIIEQASMAKEGDVTERPSSYLFIKAFTKPDGGRFYYFTSVSVSRDGKEVIVSNQEKSRNKILRLMTEESVIWRTPNDAATSSAEKQGLDYVHPNNAEDETKGSGITPQSTSSAGKVTESQETEQVGARDKAEDAKSAALTLAEVRELAKAAPSCELDRAGRESVFDFGKIDKEFGFDDSVLPSRRASVIESAVRAFADGEGERRSFEAFAQSYHREEFGPVIKDEELRRLYDLLSSRADRATSEQRAAEAKTEKYGEELMLERLRQIDGLTQEDIDRIYKELQALQLDMTDMNHAEETEHYLTESHLVRGLIQGVAMMEHELGKVREERAVEGAQAVGHGKADNQGSLPNEEAKAEEVKDETPKEYKYRLKLRPFGIGTQPDGHLRHEKDGSAYGTVVYDHPLTRQEAENFSLVPVTEAKGMVGRTFKVPFGKTSLTYEVLDVNPEGNLVVRVSANGKGAEQRFPYHQFMDAIKNAEEVKEGEPSGKVREERAQEGAQAVGHGMVDNQGNPLNEDGSLKVEMVQSVDELTDEDFTNPSRNVQLPALPENIDNAIGVNGKPVVIKKNIFGRNAERHNDLTPAESREILLSALYNPDLYGQNQKRKRPYNWVVINTKDEKGHNRVVLLEVNENKDNVEIVHWHYLDERGLEKIRRQAANEDGQLLILPSEKTEEVGALSDPIHDLSSAGKVTESQETEQVGAREGDANTSTSQSKRAERAKTVEEKEGSRKGGFVSDVLGKDVSSVAKLEAKKVTVENFAARNGLGAHLYGVHYQDGFIEASNNFIAVRVRGEYPSENEGKIISASKWADSYSEAKYKKGDAIDAKYPNIMKLSSEKPAELRKSGKNVVEIEESLDELIGLAKAALAAWKVLDGSSPKCRLRCGCMVGADMLLESAAMAKKHGMTDVFRLRERKGLALFQKPDQKYVFVPEVDATRIIFQKPSRTDEFVVCSEMVPMVNNPVCLTERGIEGDFELSKKFPTSKSDAAECVRILTILANRQIALREGGDIPTFKEWDPVGYDMMKRKKPEFAEYIGNMPIAESDVSGKVREERAQEGAQAVSEAEAGLRDALVDVARAAGVEVVTDSKEGQRVLDEVNGKARKMAFGEEYDYNQFPVGRVEPELLSRSVEIVPAERNHGFANYDEAKTWAKDHIVRTLTNEESGGKGRVKISGAAVGKYLSESAVAKSDNRDVHLAVLRVLPDVICKSIEVETTPDFKKDENGVRKAGNEINKDVLIHRCYGAVEIDGQVYRVKVTLKEYRDENEDNKAYSYEATKIELLAGTLANDRNSTTDPGTNSSLSAAKLLNGVMMSYDSSKNVLDESAKMSALVREHRVFHGSGAEFDAFDHSHMGEGEGMQAYGWGTYVTEVEGIGRTYAEQISRKQLTFKGEPVVEKVTLQDGREVFSPEKSAYNIIKMKRSVEGAREFVSKAIQEGDSFGDTVMQDFWQKVKDVLSNCELSDFKFDGGQRFLYTIEIPEDNGSNYLHWEKPLTREQFSSVAEGLKAEGWSEAEGNHPTFTKNDNKIVLNERAAGYDVYAELKKVLGSQQKASEFLSSIGFTGVSYPAQFLSGGREDGARNFVIFNEKDAQITDHVRFFKTENGEAYGYTVGGKVYLDPKIATTETAVHELTHLWADMLRKENPKEWKHVVELMKGTPVWEEVKAKYPELKTEDEIADEVLAHYSGRRGAERLRAEQERLAREEGVSMLDRASAVAAIERVKDALNSFWKKVADLLGVHFKSAEEVADAALADILNGRVKPVAAEGMKEDRKELVAVHNITEDKLKQAMELGGFPMPSIAITKAGVGHTSFGDISLVFGKESINPTDKRNKVYGEDAWTPVFPGVGYKLDSNKTAEIYRRANNAAQGKELPLYNPVMFHPDNYRDKAGANGAADLVEHFKNSYDAKQLYLAERGHAVTEYAKREEEKYTPERIRLYEKMLEEIGLERLQNESLEELREDIKRLYKAYGGVDIDQRPRRYERAYLDGAKRNAVDYALHGNRNVADDVLATQREIDGRIDQQQFEEWLGEMFSGIVEKKGVRNDKDAYTPSGNARKWEQLYDEITLDNVMAVMQKQAAKGGEGLLGGNIFGTAQAEYQSIDEIRKAAKERIRTINEEEYQAQRSAITDRLSAIVIPGSGSGFSDSMKMVQHIQDAVAKSHTAKGIHKYLKKFYPGITMETANEIADIVKDIQHMSARYFEAKPYRAVGFDEVKLAVVPSDMDASLKERLEQMGIEVRTYASGDQAQRKQVVDEATEELRIRFQLVGEKGAANMDKAEEATTRLDNLSVAREMEEAGKDAKSVKLATGWERGADGKWRYEVGDIGRMNFLGNSRFIRNNPDAQRYGELNYKKLASLLIGGEKLTEEEEEEFSKLVKKFSGELDFNKKPMSKGNQLTLGDYFDADELFAAYPELEDVPVYAEQLENGVLGYASEADSDFMGFGPVGFMNSLGEPVSSPYKIVVSQDFLEEAAKTLDESVKHRLQSVFIHEIQHLVQEIEGFAKGGSATTYRNHLDELKWGYDVWSWAMEFEAKQQELGKDASREDVYYELVNEFKEDGYEFGDGYAPSREVFDEAYKVWTRRGYDNGWYEAAYNEYQYLTGKFGLGFENNRYHQLAGEVEARNAANRMDMTAEERRASLAEETEDVAREDQVFIMDGIGMSEMGSRINGFMAEIGTHFQGVELDDAQKAVVDVYGGKSNNLPVEVERKDGKRKVVMRQGTENKAGTKHSLFRHYKRGEGNITAEDLLLIPEVLRDGEMKTVKNGRGTEYSLVKDGVRYKVYTETKKGIESFCDFYTNKKGNRTSTSTSEEEASNQVENTQLSARGYDSIAKGSAKVVEEFENPSVQGRETDDASYREVEQGELLDELRKASKEGRTVRVYRTMQVIDGKLYSPMAKKVAGQETSEIKFRWEAAEEHPELARRGDGSKSMPNEESFYITIDKGQGKGALTVAYNPYTHTSRTVLNDQFSSAFVRPNLVVVEVEVPESELEGLYKAEKAKDSVGEMSWHSGAVSGKLAELGNPRKVILSRYDRPVRILTKKEEAELIAKQLEGTGIAMPYNLVTPQVREELEKLGVKIDEKPSGSVSKNASFGKAEYVTDEQIEAMNGRLQANAVSSPEAMTEAARALSEQLGVPVEIVTDVDSITHPNEAVEAKRRRAKGWYEKGNGRVVVVVPNHLDVEDVAATVFHEVVAHRGLRELVGEQGYDEFLMEVFNHSKADVRERIMALAGKHGWDIPKAVDEYLGGLAERGFEDFSAAERGMWQWLKAKVLEAIDKFLGTLKLPKSVKLGDNELRYLLWRSHENLRAGREGMVKRAKDVAKRYELGLLENEAGERKGSETMTEEESEDLYRTAYHEAAARDAYERRVKSGLYQSREALQDSMLGLRTAMEEVLKAEGSGYSGRVEDIPGFENAYLGENRLSSVNQAEVDEFGRRLFNPLMKVAASFGSSKEARQALTDYMMAKHGLERNALMRERAKEKAMEELEGDELQKKLNSIEKRDFAGLTALTGEKKVADAEQAAQRLVDDFEQAYGDGGQIDALWKAVRGVTGATLKKMKDSGLLTKEQFDEISGMYDYYIPLRGFEEQTAEDVYDYLGHGGNGGAFTSPIKKAEGRKSKADDPFAYMAAMAESAIMQGNRNVLVKQKFLNFVLNHPSDLVSVSDLWLRYDAASGEWRVAQSGDIAGTEKLEEGDSPEEVERKMAVFEERMQAEAKAHPKEYKRQKEHPEIPYRVVEKQDLREHQVIVKRNGRDYVLTINGSPRAAQALNGLTNPNLDASGVAGTLLSGVRNTTNYLSQVYTTRNPNFVGSNWARDAIYSNIMAGLKEDKEYGRKFSKAWREANPGSMSKLYYLYAQGKLDMNDEKQRLFAEFMANGGETGYMSFRQIEERKNEIARQLKLYGGKMPLRKGWRGFWNLVDYSNRVVENQSRFAAYMASRRLGRTIDRSIYDAKEITVNFNKKGAGSTFYNAKNQTLAGKVAGGVSGLGRFGFAFWNAAIQGTTNFARFVKRNPKKGVAVSLATMAMGYAVPLIAAILHDDDDDKEGSGYFDLPDAVRRNNIVFRFPGMESWITIPLPVEYRALYGLGELTATAMYRASTGMPMTDGEIAGQAMGQISQLMPLDLSEGGGMDFTWGASGNFNALAPTAVKPVAEAWTNKSWTGLPIYKDTPYNKQDPEWTKAFRNTNTFLVKMCKQLNEWTGGDAVKGGAVDLNPAVMEHLLKGYLGGYMQTADQFGKLGETIFGDRENEFRNWPIVSRFLKEGDERTKWRAVTERYFALKEEAEETDRLLRRYKKLTEQGDDHKAEINELVKTDAYKRMKVYDFFEKDIQRIQDVLKRKDLSDEKRKKVEGDLNKVRLDLLKAVEKIGE